MNPVQFLHNAIPHATEIRCRLTESETYHCNIFERDSIVDEVDTIDEILVGDGVTLDDTWGVAHVYPEGAIEQGERPKYLTERCLEYGLVWRADGQLFTNADEAYAVYRENPDETVPEFSEDAEKLLVVRR